MKSSASLAEAVSVAAGSLRGSKLRSFLTLLGIILATTTLIAVMSLIHGMDVYIAQQVSDMGGDGFKVMRIPVFGEVGPKKYLELKRKNPELRREEYDFLKSHLTLCRATGLEGYVYAPLHYLKTNADSVFVRGVTADMGVINNVQVASGRFFTEQDDQRRRPFVFIGNDVKNLFFPEGNPLDKTIYIQGRLFRVVGCAKAQGSVFGQSQDNFVMIPLGAFFKMFGSEAWMEYFGVAADHGHLYEAEDEMRSLLRAFRHLRPTQEDNFSLIASDTLSQAWDKLTGTIAATAIAVVSVFMVVGGVVIMNIMLAVVTERTHEIGIRKAVGARGRDILSQFLVESAMLAGAGGVIGFLIAWGLAALIRNMTPVPMAVPPVAVFLSVLLSSSVGLFFGIYPARRAARLDPIQALRAEK